jgi:hypothetical protein
MKEQRRPECVVEAVPEDPARPGGATDGLPLAPPRVGYRPPAQLLTLVHGGRSGPNLVGCPTLAVHEVTTEVILAVELGRVTTPKLNSTFYVIYIFLRGR